MQIKSNSRTQLKLGGILRETQGGTYLLIHFLGNFREKTKKVPTHSLFRKLSEISPKFPKKLEALLLVKQLGKGNFLDSRKFPEPYYYSHS